MKATWMIIQAAFRERAAWRITTITRAQSARSSILDHLL